jgi:NAD(P)-dependent dehydrogenase (short-subunit alcohol dehydrogenase family)
VVDVPCRDTRDARKGHGVITNISSTGSRMGSSVLFAYGIAKGRRERDDARTGTRIRADNIRVNSVLPGAIETPLGLEPWSARDRDRTRDELVARRAKLVPLGRMGSAWDVAHAVAFLSSDDADFMTGVDLPVDGGALTIVAAYRPPPARPATTTR